MKISKVYRLSAFALALGLFSSCLKDKGFEDREYGVKGPDEGRLVTLGDAKSAPDQLTAVALDLVPDVETINLVYVTYDADQPADKDITVTLALKPTLISDFNSNNGTSLVEMPANTYTIGGGSLKVTIPKGQRKAYLPITLTKSLLDLTQAYALGFTIQSCDDPSVTIASNKIDALYNIGLKNKWDGVYRVYGFFSHPTPANTGPFDVSGIHFETTGPTTVGMYHPPSGGGQPFILGFFGVYPVINIQPNNSCLVSAAPQVPTTHPLGSQSRYDPATKTFYIYYAYNTSAPRLAWDTCVYLGPR
jgi:Domain of unknown function (DUF1735)